MKTDNKLTHTIEIENEFNEKVTIAIYSDDIIQVNAIGTIFMEYKKLKTIKVGEKTDFDGMIKQLNIVAEQMEKVNEAVDKAFGKELREKAFRGSSSLSLYNSFFKKLDTELEKAGLKVKDYIKETRKKELIGKGKNKKDTI